MSEFNSVTFEILNVRKFKAINRFDTDGIYYDIKSNCDNQFLFTVFLSGRYSKEELRKKCLDEYKYLFKSTMSNNENKIGDVI